MSWPWASELAGVTDWRTVLVTLGMVAITTLSRSAFFLSRSEWQLPAWAQRGLNYAPIAALAAVVVPQIILGPQGELLTTWQDARVFGALAGVAYFRWRQGVLGTIMCGMAVFLVLRLGLGW
jgi:branched-subunit amino acid transport protein